MYGTLCLLPIGDRETSVNNRTDVSHPHEEEKKVDNSADGNYTTVINSTAFLSSL